MTAWAGLASLLLLAGLAAWLWWPGEVAPQLTPEMIKSINHSGTTVTVIDGGSRRDAHTLWARYHDRQPFGEPPTSPRLLGISLAKVESEGAPGNGTYWVVYSDRVWNQSFGHDESASGFGQEVIFVRTGSLKARSSTRF